MAGKRLGITEIVRNVDQPEGIQRLEGGRLAAGQCKAEQCSAIGHLALCQIMLRMACQPRIADLRHARPCLQPGGECRRGLRLAVDPKRDGLQRLHQHPGVERAD